MSNKVAGSGPAGTNGKVAPKNVVDIKDERTKRWRDKLYQKPDGKSRIKNVVANGLVALREAPEWQGALRFDENAQSVQLNKQPPPPWPQTGNFITRAWNEQDDTLLSEWLTRYGIDLSSSAASEAALTVARESAFHPIRDYLNSLSWDGVPRTASWLVDFLGADNTGSKKEYHSAIGQRWLISAVARIMNPGCQVDHVIIFEGLQGNGKSTILRELCGDAWFTDQSPDLNDHQDAAMSLEGKWIVELAELDAFKGVTQERLKSFITRPKDHIRRPWGRRFIDMPRQVVFAGTTNRTDYFNDETGNRRYWPFRATKLDIAGVKAARDQLWAEAYTLYKAKSPYHLDTPELLALATEAQDERFDVDSWEPEVEFMVRGTDEIEPEAILERVAPAREHTTTDFRRLAKILRHLKFEPARKYNAVGKRIRYFKRIAK